ncbi:MAG: TrpB-like pyridoxal phosphate-dependent enzyme [Candidatus Alcyoniella australis]|nr:TrpB-like pyridoxal phosphate-dependent enzyme [Candidatus Alcyoniella australis]
MKPIRFELPFEDSPQNYYNIVPDLPTPPPPPLHPGTGEPLKPDEMEHMFPRGLIEQEISSQREIPIPEPVREAYALYRPSPLIRAARFEKALGTPAKIYFKYEGVSPVGSHKANTALAQAYYNKLEGIDTMTTETGAGQWGSALAMAGSFFGLKVRVYMVRVSFDQKPYRRVVMETYGAQAFASPSQRTETGRKVLAEFPDTPGSLAIAISEAIEDAIGSENTKYGLGSVLNHVMLHQTVIGQEALKQFKLANDYPDVVIGCHGGGSNFSGMSFPFVRDKINGRDLRIIAVEPRSCPSLTKGKYEYDFGDKSEMTPLLKMHTLGHNYIPPGIHAGGLRYHGAAPLVSHLLDLGLIEAKSVPQGPVFKAGIAFARTEGIIPAPETCHAIAEVVSQAERCKQEGKAETIVFNLSGHGMLDLSAYDDYLSGKLVLVEGDED